MGGFDPKAFAAGADDDPVDFDPKAFAAGGAEELPVAAPGPKPIPDVTPSTVADDIATGVKGAAGAAVDAIRHPINTAVGMYDQVNNAEKKAIDDARAGGQGTLSTFGSAVGAGAVEAGKIALSFTKVGIPVVGAMQGMQTYKAAKAAGHSDDDAYAAAFHDALQTSSGLGAAHVGGAVIGKAAGAVADAPMSMALKDVGISPEEAEYYRQNAPAVTQAAEHVQNPDGLRQMVDDKMTPVLRDVDNAGDQVSQAQAAASDAGNQAAVARSGANQSAADAYRVAKEGLDKAGAPEGMAGNIVDSLNDQGEKLGKMSGESFDILDQEGHTFRTEDMADAVDKQMASLKIGHVDPTVGPDAAAFGALGKLKQMINNIGENAKATTGDTAVPASVVKQLIQTLDATSRAAYSGGAGALGPEAAVNLARVRGMFNGALRDASPLPETPTPMDRPPASYAEAMDRLAPQVQLVQDMSKVFGTEQKAMTALNAAANPETPQGFAIRSILKRYDDANGTTFTKDLGEFFKAKETLQSPTALNDFKNALPEVQTANSTLPEEAQAQQAKQHLAESRQSLADSKAVAQQFDRLGPNSSGNSIKGIQQGRNPIAAQQLEGLDPGLAKTVKDTGLAAKFARKTTNGSRRAKIFAGIGGAVGLAAGELLGGHPGAIAGAVAGKAVGGFVGGLIDNYGGQAVKVALDAGVKLDKLAGTPYAAAIMEAAQQGPQRLGVVHYLYSSMDPGYQLLQQSADNQDDDKAKIIQTHMPAE